MIGMSQETLSRYEEKEKIDDEMLGRISKELGVSVEFIKEMEDDKPLTFYIENNTVTNENNTTAAGGKTGNITGNEEGHTVNTYVDKDFYTTLLDRMQAIFDQNRQLFGENNKLLQEKIAALEKEIAELKKR